MTEDTERRLRDALHAEGADIPTRDDEAWAAVQRRVGRERRRSLVRRGAVVGAAAAVLAVVVGIGALRDGDDTTVDVTPAQSSSTSSTSTSTAPPTTTALPDGRSIEGVWPFVTASDVDAYVADPGVGLFFDPEQTALEFAREYLGMPDPVAPRGFQAAEGESGSVDVLPRAGSPMTTRVWVHRYGGEEAPYTVYFAETDNIRPGAEAHGITVADDVIGVSGTSTAFEAQVEVEVRDSSGAVLGRTYVMGGANGEMGAFTGEVEITAPSTPTGAVVLSTSSMEDGSLQEATVVPVTFAATANTFSVFFHRGEELVEVPRTGPRTAGVLRQALEALVAGPTPDERAAGLDSLFSDDTADVLAGVTIADGTAIVDLAHEVNNASASAASQAFLAELDGTVFQFPSVERVEYRLRGSCDAFWTWLQVGACQVVDRP